MHQSVYTARQSNKNSEVSDRLYLATYLVSFLMSHCKIFPRVNLALLHTERNTPPLLIDFQDHYLDFIAELHYFGRVNILVCPIHFRYMNQSFDTLLNLYECPIVGKVADLAK